MTDMKLLLSLVLAGDTDRITQLAESGAFDDITGEEKALLVRTAASHGLARTLRHLFENNHLYSTDEDADGRTLLHAAASSGDAETTAFAMDVLGYDPMTADAHGRTALDEAHDAPDQSAYRLLTGRLGFSLDECYRNPVLRGFHPDPSIVRVGEDYYMVNSSFMFFPCLPISHSRDLVHWQVVGHAVEDLALSGLTGLPGGFGYWAPDISFYRGRFWVVATLRRNTPPYRLQMITSAADPRGPWDAPKFLPLDGIDPSLFTDDDGRRYILLNPGAIMAEIGPEGDLLSAPELIYFGSTRIKSEGPHLVKKDGWYYLFLAEGGTGPGHMETVARSRSLHGPYQACPHDPILGRVNPFSPIQRSGHGKPVMLPDGRWMMVYLCGRSVEGKTVMGRETALDPMEWTSDGWPMVNHLKGPSCLQRMPLPAAPCQARAEWLAPRTDPRSFACESADEITLTCGQSPSGIGPCSVLLHRQTEAGFRQAVRVDMRDASPGTLAGLIGYYDENSHFIFGLEKTADGCTVTLTEQIGPDRRTLPLRTLDTGSAGLAIHAHGLERRLCLVENGTEEELLCLRTEYLSDEGLALGKRFTGALLGIAAIGQGKAHFTGYSERMTEER